MKADLLTVLITVVVSTGCSVFLPDMPKTGATATGQPLSLREDLLIEREHYKDKVATVRDEDGHTVGEIYEEGTRLKHIPVWYGYQGSEYIDAEDYFRIARDAESEGRVRRSRKLAYIANRGGWIAAVAGVGLVVVTSVLPTETPGRTGIFVAGLVGMIAGSSSAIWGAKRLAPERHGVGSLTAAAAAEQYNQGLQRGSDKGDSKPVRVGMRWEF